MKGISAASAYIPYYRINRSTIGGIWERKAFKGERSVANVDEDSLTMASEAALGCCRQGDRGLIDALYMATTTPPYAEKSTAATLAVICGLNESIFTADFSGTPRAGTTALLSALSAVEAGRSRRALVASADCRNVYPRSDHEQLFGDGAAALVVSDADVCAEFISSSSVTAEIIDIWRNPGDEYVRFGEARFINEEGYSKAMGKAVRSLLEKTGVKKEEIFKVVFTTSGMNDDARLAKKLGFTPEQLHKNFMDTVGCCGTAQPLMLLTDALEASGPEKYILLAAYGNGADALLFKTTGQVARLMENASFSKCLAYRKELKSYARFLSFREMIEVQPGEPFRTIPSNSYTWRDREEIFTMVGSKCSVCGSSYFPINRVCYKCGAVDQYESIRFSDGTAKVFTYTLDLLAGRGDDPVVVQTVLEDDAGTRFYLTVTDYPSVEEIKIGSLMEFTFRKIYHGGNYNNYYWKARPVADGKVGESRGD